MDQMEPETPGAEDPTGLDSGGRAGQTDGLAGAPEGAGDPAGLTVGPESPDGQEAGADGQPITDRPLDPPKLIRLANLAREVLEEVRQMDPQDSTIQELAELYRRVEGQLMDALPQSLAQELDAMELDMPFNDGASRDEVRIAYSGLIGWLGGLFQGLHASLLAAAPVPLMIPGREPGPPGPMGAPPGPPRPGLEPARRPAAQERQGEGYL